MQRFTFRYPHFGNLWWYGVAIACGVAIATWQGIAAGGDLVREAVVIGAVVALVVGTYAAVHLAPHAVFGKRLIVDADGIRLFRSVLPAERIAEVVVVDRQTMSHWLDRRMLLRTRGGRWEVEGRAVAAWRMCTPWFTDLPAVLVRDRDGGERPWWLFGVPDEVDPGSFAAAVRDVAPRLEDEVGG